MRVASLRSLPLSVLVLLLLTGRLPAQDCRVDGFNNARASAGWSLIDGAQYAAFRTLLTNPGYFGAAQGAVRTPITLGGGQATVTEASLNGVQVFYTGWTLTNSYTEAERTALRNFVLAGGSLIHTADDTDHSIADLFGVTQVVSPVGGGSTNQVIVNPDHVMMNGPFGAVERLVPAGNIGQFPGVPGNGIVLAQNIPPSGNPTAAVIAIPERALGATSGRVVILNDSDYHSAFGGTIGLPEKEIFMLNVFAYACGVPNVPGGNTYYFPQIAYNGGYATRARFSSASSGTSPVVRLDSYNHLGVAVGDCGETSLVAHGTGSCVFANTPGLPVSTGWARARSASPSQTFFPTLTYTLVDGAGNIVTAVGVPPSTPGTSFTLVGPFLANSKIAIALLNLPTSTGDAAITIRAYDRLGVQAGSTGIVTLAPGRNTARFIDELVAVPPSANFHADSSVTITSTQPIAVLGLVFDVAGTQFSTIPVFPGRR